MTKKRQTNVEDSEVKPFSKKDFINNIIKKKQKNKFLSEQHFFQNNKKNIITY